MLEIRQGLLRGGFFGFAFGATRACRPDRARDYDIAFKGGLMLGSCGSGVKHGSLESVAFAVFDQVAFGIVAHWN